jgi:hypothetical protein
MSSLVVTILKGILLILFMAIFIFAGIIHARVMRGHLQRGSLFSPRQMLRSMASQNFLLFIFLALVLAAIVAAMKTLERFTDNLNREGFPFSGEYDSRCWLGRRPASDGPTSFQ